MSATGSGESPGTSIARRDLERIIRRANELAEADRDERISEDELLAIADEVGLAPRHVRRALYELPRGSGEPGLFDRLYGSGTVTAIRTVEMDPEVLIRRLEEYLSTRELLQIVRRQKGVAAFVPADDTFSNVLRTLRRPRRRYHIARAKGVIVRARSLEEDATHVRVDVNVSHERKRAIRNGFLGGTIVSLPLGAAAFFPVGAAVASVAGDPLGVAAGVVAGVSAYSLGMAGGFTISGARFRRRIADARLELQGMLDRLQRGERLEPPPSPLLRRVRSRFRSWVG